MKQYIIRRFLLIIPITFVVVTLVFFIFHLVPGDPVRLMAGEDASETDIQIMRQKMGLDKPLFVQYIKYLGNILQGDLGNSIIYNVPVSKEILSRIPFTLLLTGSSMGVALFFGLFIGIVSALKAGGWLDYICTWLSTMFLSIPNFWLGLMLIALFAVHLDLFPSGGTESATSLVLPTIALSARLTAFVSRFTRSSMLEVIRQDYIRTAYAKGLTYRVIIYKHALRNALIPIITIVGLQLGALLGGSIVVETLFTWPGIGWLMLYGISSRDYVMVQGITIVFAIGFMLVNLLVDIIYVFIDPRIKYH